MILLVLLAALVRGPGDPASLAKASDAVVHARVQRLSSARRGGQIFTTVVLQLLSAWKGAVEPQISVLVPGGSVGDLSQTVQGVAAFSPDEEVVVFLSRRAGGVYSVSRLALGKFTVRERAVRNRDGLECVGCAAGEVDEFALDELRARVVRQ